MNKPPKKPRRRSIRLRGYDYSQSGAYFVTLCTTNRKCLFGSITNGEMQLNPMGKIIRDQWDLLPDRFPLVELDEFVVMPNHIHGILVLGDALPRTEIVPTVGSIIGAYKSLCVHNLLGWIRKNQPDRNLGKMWQRNFWEHIVRNESELDRIRRYIKDNPARWESDKLNSSRGQDRGGSSRQGEIRESPLFNGRRETYANGWIESGWDAY